MEFLTPTTKLQQTLKSKCRSAVKSPCHSGFVNDSALLRFESIRSQVKQVHRMS
jgi:hypothetical protein